MFKYILFFIVICFHFNSKSQNTPFTYTKFEIGKAENLIEFLVCGDLSETKPILIFLQGSLPVPLVHQFNDGGTYSFLQNFDIKNITKKYHLVAIASPFTPLLATEDQINEDHIYVPDPSKPNQFSLDYLQNDYIEKYVERASKVIHYLKKQKWVKVKEIHVAGHSQGARVATSLTFENKNVKSIGLFGYNPFGRIEQFVRDARKQAEAGLITWEKADSITADQVAFMRSIQNADTLSKYPQYKSWQSFSKSTFPILMKIEQPIYIAYGSDDIVADQCDMLPLSFIEHGKENFSVIRYPDLEHNFFPIKEDGTIDRRNGKWKEVMNAYLLWIASIK